MIQDALEIYCVWKLTELAEQHGVSLYNNSDDKLQDYTKYCEQRDITPATSKSGKSYVSMYNLHLPTWIEKLIVKYPNTKFGFTDVEAEFRNQKKKGDFEMEMVGETNDTKSVSLKAYSLGITRIQVCSGTFNSFITNFLFTSDGVGMFLSKDGERFRGSNIDKRDYYIEQLGYVNMLDKLHELDTINPLIKKKYVYSDDAAYFTPEIETMWEHDCYHYGHQALDLTLDILRENFKDSEVKERILKMSGFDGEEDILLLDKKRCVDSITDTKIQELTTTLRSDDTTIRYYKRNKNINFDFVNANGEVILSVEIPFTLNKNGGWHLPKDKKGANLRNENYSFIEYGQRRPLKSKNIATSINTYVCLKRAGVLT